MSTVSRIVTSCKMTYSVQNNNDFENSNLDLDLDLIHVDKYS